MQQLIIDIGNSSAKVAVFENDCLAEYLRVEHAELPELLAAKAQDASIGSAILSSVIPLSESLEEAVMALPFPCLRMSAMLRMPFSIAYKTPETLGPDRLAAVAGAWCQQPNADLLVIDVGTAITYDLLTAKGTYLGNHFICLGRIVASCFVQRRD